MADALSRPPPAPSLGPDPRQAGARLSNLFSGYHAASVDVGSLQAAIEDGLKGVALDTRWDEAREWVETLLVTWLQRLERTKIERRGVELHIELSTRDERGVYEYVFDAFPDRKRGVGGVAS